jgi:hypothetical protein
MLIGLCMAATSAKSENSKIFYRATPQTIIQAQTPAGGGEIRDDLALSVVGGGTLAYGED